MVSTALTIPILKAPAVVQKPVPEESASEESSSDSDKEFEEALEKTFEEDIQSNVNEVQLEVLSESPEIREEMLQPQQQCAPSTSKKSQETCYQVTKDTISQKLTVPAGITERRKSLRAAATAAGVKIKDSTKKKFGG